MILYDDLPFKDGDFPSLRQITTQGRRSKSLHPGSRWDAMRRQCPASPGRLLGRVGRVPCLMGSFTWL